MLAADAAFIDPSAVRRAKVFDHKTIRGHDQTAVLARDFGIVDHDLVIDIAPDGDLVFHQREDFSG